MKVPNSRILRTLQWSSSERDGRLGETEEQVESLKERRRRNRNQHSSVSRTQCSDRSVVWRIGEGEREWRRARG